MTVRSEGARPEALAQPLLPLFLQDLLFILIKAIERNGALYFEIRIVVQSHYSALEERFCSVDLSEGKR